MRLALLGLAACLLSGAPTEAQTPKTYQEMKDQVVVQRFQDGRVLASSAAFAVEETSSRYLNGGKGGTSVSVLIEAWPDRPVAISFSATRITSLFEREISGRDGAPDPEEMMEAHIGPPWTDSTARKVENAIECGASTTWCLWTVTYMIDVPQDLVFDIVADDDRKKLGMSVGKFARVNWQLPREHLIATLDAIGLLHAFRPADAG